MEQLTNTIAAVLILSLMGTAFSLIERLAPLHAAQPAFRKDSLTDLAYLPLNAILMAPLLTGALTPFFFLFNWWIPDGVRTFSGAQPIWLQLLEIAVLADFGVYAGHRLLHAVPWLWKFHAIHHSATELDWITSLRSHPVDHLILKFFMLLPLTPFAFSGAALGWFTLYYALQSAFVHANLGLSFGRLGALYVGPEFHRWHHSDVPEARDKNFVSIFPWIDRLFGTHYRIAATPRTSGTDEPVPVSYLGQILYPFTPRQRLSGKA
jgi:sterol desaturase/sphingolipid hydroxylase (fatty acid hydroxylase superfamily)